MRLASLTFTLLSDGSSDCVLVPVLRWALHQTGHVNAVNGTWAELRRLRPVPTGLAARMMTAVQLYPCDLLFVHRDAEQSDAGPRYDEIADARAEAERHGMRFPVVCVVPVRMQEAWLLFDESAIRRAADNPSGSGRLQMHRGPDAERLPDPKQVLLDNLRAACGLRGRHLARFRQRERRAVHRIAEYIDDFSPLRTLPAFQRLDADIHACLATLARQPA
jgi:hypothetical protein